MDDRISFLGIVYKLYDKGLSSKKVWQKLVQKLLTWGVSSPVVSVLDSGSDGPGSSPGWGMTLCP